MRTGIVLSVTPQDRIRLEAIIADRNTRQQHAARARVIGATAVDLPAHAVVLPIDEKSLTRPAVRAAASAKFAGTDHANKSTASCRCRC